MPSAAAMVGTMAGNYRLLGVLGEGAMGTVFLGENPEIHRRVAIKVLQPELAREEYFAGRFVAEARAASAVRHANIVDILDFGRLPDGSPYIVMEHLEGETLAQRLLRAGRLPVEVAVEYARQIAAALGYAHARGVVHRDLKPANLFLVAGSAGIVAANAGASAGGGGGYEVVKVLDFGVAKLRADFSAVRTRTGAVVGTPAYLSPEQCRGNRDVDHRSDVYALGAVLYEMLCGTPPFQSDGLGDMMDQHMNIAPQPPGSRRPGIPPAIEAVVLRALAKRPADRFADMAGFQAALAGRPPPASPLRLPLPFLAATLEASSAGEVPGPARGEARPPGDPPAPRALDSDLVGTLAPPAGGPPPSLEPRSRLGRLAIAAVVVGAGALALLLAARPGARLPAPRAPDTVATPVVAPVAPVPAEPPTPAVPAAPAVAAPAAPAPAPGGATAPAAPASVTITIRSLPSGVGIFDLATGARRGVTPLVLTRPRGAAPLALALRKSGYQAQTVSIPSDADTVLQLQMVRKVAARPAAPSTAGLDSL